MCVMFSQHFSENPRKMVVCVVVGGVGGVGGVVVDDVGLH